MLTPSQGPLSSWGGLNSQSISIYLPNTHHQYGAVLSSPGYTKMDKTQILPSRCLYSS